MHLILIILLTKQLTLCNSHRCSRMRDLAPHVKEI